MQNKTKSPVQIGRETPVEWHWEFMISINFQSLSTISVMKHSGKEVNKLLYSPEIMIHGSGKAKLYYRLKERQHQVCLNK